MVEIDGIKYTVKTPSENTLDMLNRINTYCEANEVKNSKGELIQLEARMSSPLYMVLWALGYLVTIVQNLVISVGRAHNVQESSEEQLLNIADMANVKRGKPSVTTFNILVQAMTDDNIQYDPITNNGKLVITSDDTITYQGITYKPALHPSITIEPGEYGYITMVGQSAGSQSITAGTIQAFDTPIINMDKFQQMDSIPGQAQETIASLRERIQRKQYSGTNLDFAMDALRALPGVTVANIIYNTNITGDMYIGAQGLRLPPRWAMIIVQGYNENIAKTYFQYLTAPTIAVTSEGVLDYRDIPQDRILDTQIFVTHSQQQIPVLILRPYLKPLYVRVYLGMPVTGTLEGQMSDAIVAGLSSRLTVGEDVTSALVLDLLANFRSYMIQGVMVSSDGSVYGYKTTQAEDVLFTVSKLNIQFVQPEVSLKA